MYQNYEIKVRYENLKFAEKQAIMADANLLGIDHQRDTYFVTGKGRLKLRFSDLSEPYLIPYLREDQKGIKLSRYEKIPVENADSVREIFASLLGVEMEIRKTRTIYIYENVRIHLDKVEKLGSFIELEAVFNPTESDEESEKMKINHLMNLFEINSKDLLADSYYDLMREENEKD